MNYNQQQKNVLLKTYEPLSQKQRISVISLYFFIVNGDQPSGLDFQKIERELDLFNLSTDCLSGYSGWDGIVEDLKPINKSLKEFIFISSLEFSYVNNRMSEQRMNQAEKRFSRLGITADKALELMAKARALKNDFF